jgi:large subunit ribosomal protein L29
MIFMTLKHQEILKLSEKELNEKAIELKQELAKERAVIASGTRSEKPGKIRKIRREIARLLTALTMKTKKGAKK